MSDDTVGSHLTGSLIIWAIRLGDYVSLLPRVSHCACVFQRLWSRFVSILEHPPLTAPLCTSMGTNTSLSYSDSRQLS